MAHEDFQTPDDPNLRAFDALMRMAFPRYEALTPHERELASTIVEMDKLLCELRDLVAQMRASLAELRHDRVRREGFKP